jgi:hypothetical protein
VEVPQQASSGASEEKQQQTEIDRASSPETMEERKDLTRKSMAK